MECSSPLLALLANLHVSELITGGAPNIQQCSDVSLVILPYLNMAKINIIVEASLLLSIFLKNRAI